MKVYYGYSYLTEKAVKKRELCVYFENTFYNPIKLEDWVKRRMNIVYTRYQTDEEKKDCVLYTRSFAKYSYFIDEKPFYSDIEKVLETNFQADKNHVSFQEREHIKHLLREAYYHHFNIQKPKVSQLNLFTIKNYNP